MLDKENISEYIDLGNDLDSGSCLPISESLRLIDV